MSEERKILLQKIILLQNIVRDLCKDLNQNHLDIYKQNGYIPIVIKPQNVAQTQQKDTTVQVTKSTIPTTTTVNTTVNSSPDKSNNNIPINKRASVIITPLPSSPQPRQRSNTIHSTTPTPPRPTSTSFQQSPVTITQQQPPKALPGRLKAADFLKQEKEIERPNSKDALKLVGVTNVREKARIIEEMLNGLNHKWGKFDTSNIAQQMKDKQSEQLQQQQQGDGDLNITFGKSQSGPRELVTVPKEMRIYQDSQIALMMQGQGYYDQATQTMGGIRMKYSPLSEKEEFFIHLIELLILNNGTVKRDQPTSPLLAKLLVYPETKYTLENHDYIYYVVFLNCKFSIVLEAVKDNKTLPNALTLVKELQFAANKCGSDEKQIVQVTLACLGYGLVMGDIGVLEYVVNYIGDNPLYYAEEICRLYIAQSCAKLARDAMDKNNIEKLTFYSNKALNIQK